MAKNNCFIDTGAYFACFYKQDRYHSNSLKIWKKLEADTSTGIVTTNHILNETATLLSRRASYKFAALKLKEIYNSDILIKRPTQKDEIKALDFFLKFADQKVSLTDSLSFVVMQKLGIKKVFTFDRHFEYAGFEMIS